MPGPVTRRIVLAAALALLCGALAACPRPAEQETAAETLTPTPGATDEILTPGRLPDGWPDEFPPYPDARIVAGRSWTAPSGRALSVRMETGAEAQPVSDFYAARAAAAGYTVVSTSQTERRSLSQYAREQATFAVTLEEGKPTQVDLTLLGLPSGPAEPPLAVPPGDPPEDSAPPSAAGRTDEDQPPPKRRTEDSGHPLLPVYPGATSRGLRTDQTVVTLNQTTSDEMQQVQDFYRRFYTERGFNELQSMQVNTQITITYRGFQGDVTVLTGQAPADESAQLPERTLIHLSFVKTNSAI